MPMGLTQDAAFVNQTLADLFRKNSPIYFNPPHARFSRHVTFLSVMSLIDRRSEFSFVIRRRDCPTYH